MRHLFVLLMVLFSPLGWAEPGDARDCGNKASAKLVSLQGKLYVDTHSQGDWQEAQLNQNLCEGSRIRVDNYSRASLLLPDDIVLRLDQGTVLSLNGIAPEKPTFLDLLNGFVHFISRTPRHLQINTPIANAGPEGTEFALRVDAKTASLWVYEGGVKFFNTHGSLHLKPGDSALAELGQAPRSQIDIHPQDAVNWALYYPPILPYPAADANIDKQIRIAIENYRHGQVEQALSSLGQFSQDQHTAYFYKIRAAMLLSVGQINQANQDIQAILAINANDAEAFALQAILALTQNHKDQAFQLANKAIAANPQSASAYSALSYAEQGRFNLEPALTAAKQAVKLAAHDAMVWARQAELELAQGETSDSKQTALRALALDANLERTQTVTGFAYLLRMDTDEALQTFNKAVTLDSSSPLARLGLGLAKIRNGDLAQGRQDLEIAAILDPNNSLIRSYLGKAYYEEKRNPLAEDQFSLAKVRDPKDPTPWFYDAIKKQTENRPVEALRDLQKAIELNDNRAVYRSKQLLDNDLAIRNTSLARIYDDLGFDTRATVEATKSLATDPANYSAHRFLSDAYVRLPRREIAQVSELLQSQLLQPLNNNPIQPHLSVKGLSTMSGLGAIEPSFKDFTSAFERHKSQLITSGGIGSNGTYSDEIVLYGLHNKTSYSLGQYYFNTDGFRKNANVTHNIYNAFLQTALTSDVNLQFEFRNRQTQQGDIHMRLFDNLVSPLEKRDLNQTTGRTGIKISLSPKSLLLGSFIYSDRTENLNLSTTPKQSINNAYNGFEAEGQYIYDTNYLNTIFGIGNYNITNKNTTNIDKQITKSYNQYYCDIKHLSTPCNLIHAPVHNSSKKELESYSIYNYTNIKLPENTTWTIGLSYEIFQESTIYSSPNLIHNINPKIGVQWLPSDWLRIRGAYLKTSKRQLLVDQTIEPTQVAGFNQFYDDLNSSSITLKGIGLDANFGTNIYSSIEFIERNIEYQTNKSLESQINYYLNFTFSKNWSFSLEEKYERYNSEHMLETNQNPLTLKYFDSSGLFGQFTTNFVWQRKVQSYNVLKSKFPVLGVAIGYRLPKKMGIISLDIQNLTNEKFLFEDTSTRTSDQFNIIHQFLPSRTLMFKAVLNFDL